MQHHLPSMVNFSALEHGKFLLCRLDGCILLGMFFVLVGMLFIGRYLLHSSVSVCTSLRPLVRRWRRFLWMLYLRHRLPICEVTTRPSSGSC